MPKYGFGGYVDANFVKNRFESFIYRALYFSTLLDIYEILNYMNI